MQCSRGVKVLSGAKTQALARVMITMDVSGENVDMVKAFESLALPDDAAKPSDDHPARLVVEACRILKDMPDMVIGLKNVGYVDLSAEELKEVHNEFNANNDFCWNVLISLHGCLCAFAQVAKRKSCELKDELKDRLNDWVERVAIAYYENKIVPEAQFETNAARIEDLEFGFSVVTRCAINGGDRTSSVAWYRPGVCPDAAAWTKAKTALSEIEAVKRPTVARRSENCVWEAAHLGQTYEEMRVLDELTRVCMGNSTPV
ncbi:hypothetical protein GNI_061210 [Gregarina niphandrodes]|uniref:Uncharacterized protein n=1 Tax=Gregarina niphandrodes TaxID=110365 RepID=A0A023B8E1_GRENI|nr:hypothetical protein GNI_061210 [Gregarina niphandrodes]EZG68853.1 hypothetical protein GNI_061210 [Gregarina niphandrodes]|eukprot:XP_011134547.1 hypothetical protein GNI_061210 [Gregarina niphandrodes]